MDYLLALVAYVVITAIFVVLIGNAVAKARREGALAGLSILSDPYTGGTAGTVRVIALQDIDIGLRHVQSFSAMQDAITT